MGLLIST